MKGYRVRRPKEYEELLNLLRDKEAGVFLTLKSALVFSAAVGFKQKKRLEFSESSEPIVFTLFNDHQEKPFIYSLALTEFNDVTCLQEDGFVPMMKVFEEYAAGGLRYLDGVLDKANIKESIESILSESEGDDLIFNIADGW